MRKIFMLIVGAAFGSGLGLIFVLESLDTSFKSTPDAAAFLGLPYLAAFPALEAKRPRRKIILNNVMTGFSLLIALGLFGVLGVMALKGVDPTLRLFHGIL
jgi:amino acid transporter